MAVFVCAHHNSLDHDGDKHSSPYNYYYYYYYSSSHRHHEHLLYLSPYLEPSVCRE